jgi:hypothetical protein
MTHEKGRIALSMEEVRTILKIGGFYQHYKKKVYRIDDIIIFEDESSCENGLPIVIYSDISGNKFARLAHNFIENVVPYIGENKVIKRFTFLDKKLVW